MLDEYVKAKNVRVLTKFLFNIDLTPSQERIVRLIAYAEHQRVCINAMTRYGKSMCVAIGTAIYIWLHKNKKVAIIAPQEEQASIIRNYIADYISSCPRIAKLVDIGRDNTIDRLKKEASRRRWTFTNGCELRTISAHGEANRLMGFGADLVVVDEAALVSREAYAKIVRMLGDDPENSLLIELANPWNRDNKYYDHYSSGRFKTIRIGWQIALKENRVSEVFLDEVRQELTPIEFTVLYESEFPEEAEDSLFSFKSVQDAQYKEPPVMPKSDSRRIISCDVADKGVDRTVIMWGCEAEGLFVVEGIYSEPKSENMQIAGKIVQLYEEYGADQINIDTIGVGVGVVSRVREVLRDKKVTVVACNYGEGVGSAGKELRPRKDETLADRKSDSVKKRFLNRKAEQFFRLKDLFDEGMIQIPEKRELFEELMKMKWELTSSGKVRILDPEDKSPDYADALVYFIWKSVEEVYFSFAKKR